MTAILYRFTAQLHIRSFCTTCQVLSQPPKVGESSRQLNRAPKTRAGSISLSSGPCSSRPKGKDAVYDGEQIRPVVKLRRGNREFLDKITDQPRTAIPSHAQQRRSRRGSWTDTISNSYSSAVPSEIASQIDLNAKIQIKGIDLQTSLPIIFSTKSKVYRSSLFNLRSIQFNKLPSRRLPPFDISQALNQFRQNPILDKNENGKDSKESRRGLYFTIITSKNAVSKLAIERNRSKRRFKSALDSILNKDEDFLGMGLGERKGLVNPEYAYVASITSELYDAPFQQIQSDILDGLKFLNKSQTNKGHIGVLPQPKYIPRGKVNVPLIESSGKGKVLEDVI